MKLLLLWNSNTNIRITFSSIYKRTVDATILCSAYSSEISNFKSAIHQNLIENPLVGRGNIISKSVPNEAKSTHYFLTDA